MLNPNLFENFQYPYKRLPESAFKAAVEGIQKCGFSPNTILPDYSISSRINDQPLTIKINALVFADEVRHIPDYASIALFNAVNGESDEELVRILAESTSAPFHLIHRDEEFSFLAISVIRNNKPETLRIESHISYEQIANMLSNYAYDLEPHRIINAKQGRETFTHPIFRNMVPLQLPLWAAEVTRPLLVQYFGSAVNSLRSDIFASHDISSSSKEMDEVTDLAIQLLGATILADMGVLGEEIRLAGSEVPLGELLPIAYSRYSRYFDRSIIEKYPEAAMKAYKLLRQIRYAGFMPDMLRDLYIEAYSEEERKVSGSYDTPLYLTRQIWKNIPVEYLPPSQRIVEDMTCGWGSFLIAGHERLSYLSDMKSISLRNYLRGNDKYPLTAKLAGLGLLLSTLEDSWNIHHEDALNWNRFGISQPNIIVGNPPFRAPRGVRDGRRASLTTEPKRHQEADNFLRLAINYLAPGGYLAMVMPRSFTAAESSHEFRKELLTTCDVLELWQLPSGIFKGVNPQSMVVFAQKKSDERTSHYPVRVRTIQKATRKDFQEVGIFTASQITTDQSTWNEILYKSEGSENTHIMEYNLALSNSIWQRINEQCIKLNECADIFRGAIVGSRRRYATNSDSKQVPWLTNARKVIRRPFGIHYESPPQTKLYPNDFEEPRLSKKQIFEGSKVLVVHSPDPSWGKRAKVAIERKGYYVSGSFWIVSPLTGFKKAFVTNEVLAAIISWDVSNAWLIEHMTSLGIPEYAMNTIPFPKNLSQGDCEALKEAVLNLEAAAKADEAAPLEATQRIDTILKAAYHLDDATFERLRKISEWDEKPLDTLDPIPDIDKTNWILSGIVDSINAEEGTITLWMEGFEEMQTVQIAASMPGWMLRPGTSFRTKIPVDFVEEGKIDRENIDWGIFRPQPYTYMNQEELFGELAKLLREDDEQRIS